MSNCTSETGSCVHIDETASKTKLFSNSCLLLPSPISEGDKIVVFEKIYDVAENGEDQDEDILIAVHEDLSDEGQTVSIHFRPSTGEIMPTYTKIGAAILALGTFVLSIVIRRKKKLAA